MARLLRSMARTAAVSSAATSASVRARHRQETKIAAKEAKAARGANPQPAPQDDMDHQIAQLEKLAKLKEQGVITPEEFDAKKKQILGL
jgi:hypothetical protein